MRLFLRYQTTVQREYDTAMRELQKAKAERERQEYERAAIEIAIPRAVRTQPAAQPEPVIFQHAASVGFASQTLDADSELLANAA